MDLAKKLILASHTSRRELEKFQGLAAFAAQILPWAKLHAHLLPSLVSQLPTERRDALRPKPSGLDQAILWWTSAENLSQSSPLTSRAPNRFLWTDASSQGYGIYAEDGRTLQGVWGKDQQTWHINELELLAVILALESPLVSAGQSVLVSLDNLAAVFCIKNHGSNKSRRLQDLAFRLEGVRHRRRLSVRAIHLSGSQNVVADALSRKGPIPTEWELEMECFLDLCKKAHLTPCVDAMATPLNAKLPIFISPFPHQKAHSVDFFQTDLSGWESLYIFPPTNMISRVLSRIRDFPGRVLLVTPFWPSRPWFNELRLRGAAHFPLLNLPVQTVGELILRPSTKVCSNWIGWSL